MTLNPLCGLRAMALAALCAFSAGAMAQATAQSDAAEWGGFISAPADPSRVDADRAHVFAGLTGEGPWLVRPWRALLEPERQLMSLLGEGKWAAAIKYLKDADPRVDMADEAGSTPLTLAVRGGDLPLVRELIRRGAPLDATGQGGFTPLGLAAFLGDDLMMRELLRQGANLDAHGATGQDAMHLACAGGQTRSVAALLKVRPVWRWMSFNKAGRHPLAEAAFFGHLPVVEQLHLAGVPLAEPDQYQLNALHAAALGQQTQMVAYLQAARVPVPSAVTGILIEQMQAQP
jgi:hypothetical protein